MQHISPSWHCERNTRRGPSHRLKSNLLHFAALLLIALSPRVGWAQETASTFQELRDKLLEAGTKVITLSGTYEWDSYYNLKVNGTKTLNGGGSAVIKRKSGNPHGSIVLMDGATLNVNGVIFDGQNVPSKASMIVANYNEDVSPYQYAAASLSMNNCTIKNCLLDYGTPKQDPPSIGNENYYYAIINTSGGAINFTPKNTNNLNPRTLTLQNSTFDNNRVTYLDSGSEVYNVQLNGGAISVGEYTGTGGTIQKCTFTGNKATHFGGAIAFWDMETTVTVSECTIGTSAKPNIAGYTVANPTTFPSEGNGGLGGGIAFIGPLEKTDTGPKVDITNTAINYNIATGRGGGIYVMKSGSVQIGMSDDDTTTVNYNKVARNGNIVNKGGGIYVNDHATITAANVGFKGIDINGNQAANGGGIYIDGGANQCAPKFEYCTIGASGNGNSALQNGGGIYFNGSQARFSNCTISHNSTTATDEAEEQGRGGGIYKRGSSTLYQIFEECQIHHNSSLSGGGVYVTGQGSQQAFPRTDFTRCEINNNTATNNGGGLYFYSSFAKLNESCNVHHNQAANGGGIYLEDGTIGYDDASNYYELRNNIYANTATQGGGIYYQFGTFKATNFVYDNTANEGGGVYVNPKNTVASVTLQGLYVGSYYDYEEAQFLASGNKAKNGGGIYTNPSGTPTIILDACRISYNERQSDNTTLIEKGGGLYMHNGKTHTVELKNSTSISSNKAQNGGGVYIAVNLTLKLTQGAVSGNTAETNGGGIYNNYGKVECESGSPFNISYNNATNGHGGGIYTTGLLDIECSDPGKFSFESNNAQNGLGGGIYYNVVTGTSTLASLTFTNNQANQNGGGIYLMSGNLILDDTQLKESSASNGGGVYNNGTLTLRGNTTFDNNQTTGNGGGLYNNYKKTTTIESATFKDNKAPSGHGGGIYNYGTVEGNNSTVSFTGNTATNGNGGGICNLNILNLAETGTKTFTGNTAKNGGGIYNDSIKYNEPIVVPPPPITLKKQIKAPGATNFNNGPITDEQLEGRVRLYYSYHSGNNTPVLTVDSLVLFYDSEHGGDLGINAYRLRPDNNQTYFIRMYAVYTPTQDEIDDGYGTEYRLYVSAKKLDADDSVNIGVSNTSYTLTVNGVSNIIFPTTYPGGMEGTNYVGNTGANRLNSTRPQSINLAGMANLSNCVMGGSAAEANKATAGHGGAIYILDGCTANLQNSSIMNNEAALFGGGVYICTNGIMGVKGAVRVSGNTTQRLPGTGTGQYPYLKANKEDDVCLQTIDTESKETQNTSGKIKVLGDMSYSHIGITEEQIATGVDNDPTANILRARTDRGDNIRQFTINFGGDGASWGGHVKEMARAFFFSNDTKLGVKPLPHNGTNIITTTGRLEVTLGDHPGTKWYVAGIVDDGGYRWGYDTYDPQRGFCPDLPLRTLTGPDGVFARGYDPESDHIFVVRAISLEAEQAAWSTLPGGNEVIIRYPIGALKTNFSNGTYTNANTFPESVGSREVILHRYPGGHTLSRTIEIDSVTTIYSLTFDGTADTTITNWGSGAPYDPDTSTTPNESLAPGPNLGPVVAMDNTAKPAKLYRIEMDGLSEYDGDDEEGDHNPQDYSINPESALLSVESGTQTITLKEGCEILLNNNKKGTLDLDKKEIRPGGGVFNNGTLVCDSVLIEQNQTAKSGAGMYINNGTVTLQNDSEIKDNAANENGGGVYINNSGTMQVNGTGTNGVKIQHNTAKTKGGGVYKLGTLQVQDFVTITENTAGTSGTKAVVPENVYIPPASADDQTILITEELECGSRIGVTKTKKWKGGTPAYGINGDHNYDNDDHLDSVRTVIAKNKVSPRAHALDAYRKNVFFDDKGYYSVWCFNYNASEDQQNPQQYSNQNDYFIETWRSFANPSGFASNRVSTPAGLAQFAKIVNTTGSTPPTDVIQITDIDLAGHYWEPIGFSTGSTCDPITDYQFSGNYDGQGHLIRNAISILPTQTMGLFGKLNGGSVVRTFNIGADFTGTFDGETHIGGIAGQVTDENALIDRCEAQGSMQRYGSAAANTGGIAGNVASGEVRNSFAVASTLSGTTVGGLVGSNAGTVKNAYALNNSFTGTTIGALVGNNTGTLSNAYTDASSGETVIGSNPGTKTNVYSAGATDATAYTPTIGADQLGYMYADNLVGGTPLFEKLNEQAELMGTDKYDLWARTALAYYVNSSKAVAIEKPINGDLPVLLMNNYDASSNIGAGGFRAVSNYGGSVDVLQYSGPKRDYSSYNNNPAYNNSPIDGMMTRSTGSDSHFIYGDVESGSTISMTDFKANRVSIYEHAAITQVGTLGDFDKTHVSITFDNSGNGGALSTEGMNQLGAQELPRDWHMLSTPLNNAPLGFNYYAGADNTNVASGWNTGDNGTYANNPWQNGGTAEPGSHGGTEFRWLDNTANTGENSLNRYWMTGWINSQSLNDEDDEDQGGYASINLNSGNTKWTDGYFPSTFDATLHSFNQGCIPTADESGRYPYGMDFYSWTEPNYHYINFKRNGPNHWHSDPNPNGIHEHLNYKPEESSNYPSPTENVNEEILLAGKGYFASIAEKTLLQSSGQLGTSTSDKTIEVTCSTYPNNIPIVTGWNLVGNPFHAYLDFDEFCKDNTVVNNTYIVYNADGFESTNTDSNSGNYGNGFSYYINNGSTGGAYASQYLHPHQGFFVKVETGTPPLTFSEGMTKLRSVLNWNDGSYRDDSRPAYPLVNLFLSSAKGCSDVCVVEFNRPEWGGATKLRDMYSGNGMFYAAHDDGNYAALFATPEAERIPLKFEAKDEAGDTYTIHWNTQNGDFHKLYLVDNITGVQYDMLRNSSYSFSGKKDDYWTRFYITFEVTGLDEEQDDEDDDDSTGSASTTFAFFDGSQWVVTNDGHGTATLDLIDLQGRVLHSTTLAEGQARIGLPDVAKGMYLMRMTNQNGMFVQKIVVR